MSRLVATDCGNISFVLIVFENEKSNLTFDRILYMRNRVDLQNKYYSCGQPLVIIGWTCYLFSSIPSFASHVVYTQKNLFEILLNQPEIILYLPFSNWFGSKRTSVWIQINRKMVNTIRFQVDLIRFWKDFSVCT